MNILNVELGDRSYPIYIGSGVIADAQLLKRHLKSRQVMVVTNETVAPLYLPAIRQSLVGFDCSVTVLPDGESYKTIETLNAIFEQLLIDRHSRSTTLVALGGGVVGDMTGFAAACYQRGVAFIQVPTTLLSQVDSSVGGKTGVNHRLGKNMIGAFHQPVSVLIDVDTLKTLPDREYAAGIAEVVKYGLIRDPGFFDWLESNSEKLVARDTQALIYAIERSCKNKADVVAEDETETGVRALLNLGHTFGHAIESWGEYKVLLHGEAVAIGTCIAAELSCMKGYLTYQSKDRIYKIFEGFGLPVRVPDSMEASEFIQYMQRDKKVVDGKIRLVLLKSIGEAFITSDSSVDEMLRAIECCRH